MKALIVPTLLFSEFFLMSKNWLKLVSKSVAFFRYLWYSLNVGSTYTHEPKGQKMNAFELSVQTLTLDLLRARSHQEMVEISLTYIAETDSMLDVHTDVVPTDVQELIAQAGVYMSTGEISDHLNTISQN